MNKTVIAVYSDPKKGEEALGRVFNALILAYQLKEKKAPYEIIFQGTGSRWPMELAKEDHPAHALYQAVKDDITGVCGTCADVFGATEEIEKDSIHSLIREHDIPGLNGVVDMASTILSDGKYIVF